LDRLRVGLNIILLLLLLFIENARMMVAQSHNANINHQNKKPKS